MFEDDKDGWDGAKDTRKETQGGQYLRLKDGEKALVVFPSAPYAYRQVWLGDGSEIYDPDKHDGMRPSGRFAFAVFCPVPGQKAYEPKLFDASGECFDTILEVRTKYGPRHLYEIARKGAGLDTKYTVLPERELAEGEITYLKTLTPLDAEALTVGSPSEDAGPDAPTASDPWGEPMNDDDIPF